MAILKDLNGRLAARTRARSSRALEAERCGIQGLSLSLSLSSYVLSLYLYIYLNLKLCLYTVTEYSFVLYICTHIHIFA